MPSASGEKKEDDDQGGTDWARSFEEGSSACLTKKSVARIIDVVFTELGDYFIRARPTRTALPRFSYPGFGTFTKRRRGARHCAQSSQRASRSLCHRIPP